jgi:hypothetical protein
MHFTPYIIQENENLIYDVNFFLHLYEWDKSNDLIVWIFKLPTYV